MTAPNSRRLSIDQIVMRCLTECDPEERRELQGRLCAEHNQDPDAVATELNKHLQARQRRATPPKTPPAGTGSDHVFGEYELLEELGRGGMGVVYRARQLGEGRTVALKRLQEKLKGSPTALQRFHDEATSTQGLQHANIVKVFKIGEVQNLPYFTMEYVAGGNLADWLRDRKALLKPRQAAELVETLARAVHHAHLQNIIHRDLKPDNILVHATLSADNGADDQAAPGLPLAPKITDFGIAKRLDGSSGQTLEGLVLGTPAYMAPEQAAGDNKGVGPATDVHALGVILYELLTGRPPFQGTSDQETLKRVATQEPVSPSRVQPGVPTDLDTICLKCLEKAGTDRYDSAQALADDLRRFLNGETILARPTRVGQKCWKWCRRNKSLAGAFAAAIVLLVLFVVSLVISRNEALQLAEKEQEQIRKTEAEKRVAQRRLAERYLNQALHHSLKLEFRGGMLLLARALEVCPPEDHLLRREIRTNLMRFAYQTPQLRHIWQPPSDAPLEPRLLAALSPDAAHVLMAGPGAPARLWEAQTGRPAGPPLSHPANVRAAAFSRDGKTCLTGCDDGQARVWETRTGRLLGSLEHSGPVYAVAFSRDGHWVLTGSKDRTARLWRWPQGESAGGHSPTRGR